MNTYLDDAVYDRLVAALNTVELSPYDGEPDADAVKTKLGEIAGIWPASIKEPDDIR
jgi:hypothetical protein